MSRGDVADRCVKPNVPEIARSIRDFKTKIGCRPRNVPVPQRFTQEVTLEIVRDFGLQVLTILSPLFQKAMQLFELHKEVLCRLQNGVAPDNVLTGLIRSEGE